MQSCHECCERLLDFLYGLLDAEESSRLELHLADCAACRDGLEHARKEQNLLARAALRIREVPTFAVPEDEAGAATGPLPVSAAGQPGSTMTQSRESRPLAWRRWASLSAAAAVLLAAGIGYGAYHQEWNEQHTAWLQAEKQVGTLRVSLASLEKEFVAARQLAVGKVEKQALQVALLGPAAYRIGAPGAYRVTIQALRGNHVDSHVTVLLTEKTKNQIDGQVLFKEDYAAKGELRFVLPPKLAAKVGSALTLKVVVRAGEAEEVLEQTLDVVAPAYQTYLATNKRLYRTGETLYFRSVTLDRFGLTPVSEPLPLQYTLVSLDGAKSGVLKELQGMTVTGGIGGGELALTDDLPDGDYALLAASLGGTPGMPGSVSPAARALRIQNANQSQLLADRVIYKPGDTAKMTYVGRKSASTPAAANKGAVVNAMNDKRPIALGTGNKEAELKLQTDAEGKLRFEVPVPKDIDTGNLWIEVDILGGKSNDKARQKLAVAGDRYQVEFFPEGGDLLAGVSQRVYCRLLGQPGDGARVVGTVENAAKQVVAEATFGPVGAGGNQQTLGSFKITPRATEPYRLSLMVNGKKIDAFPLPAAKAEGVALSAVEPVVGAHGPVKLKVMGPPSAEMLVVATCRGVTADQKAVSGAGQWTEVVLEPVAGSHGVLRITVYEKTGTHWRPAAERLVYRAPAEYLKLAANRPDAAKKYSPGESVRLELEARTENGALAPAWLHAWALNTSGLTPGGLPQADFPEYFYLATELKDAEDLENANIILADSAAARTALDLFLGAQGWRRVTAAPQDVAAAGGAAPAPGMRNTLAPAAPAAVALISLANDWQGAQERANAELAQRQNAIVADFQRRGRELESQLASAEAAARTAAGALVSVERQPQDWLRLGSGALIALLVAVGAVLLAAGVVALARRRPVTRTYLATSCGTVALAFLVFAATSTWRGEVVSEFAWSIAAEPDRHRTILEGELLGGAGEKDIRPPQAAGGRIVLNEQKDLESDFAGARDSVKSATTNGLTGNQAYFLAAANTANFMAEGLSNFQAPAMKAGFGGAAAQESQSQQAQGKRMDKQQGPPAQAMDGGKGIGGGGVKDALPAGPGGFGKKMAEMPPPGAPAQQDRPKGLVEGVLGGKKKASLQETAVLRDYANIYSKSVLDGTETVLWQPVLLAENGTATVAFDLSGRPGAYLIIVQGHTADGRLGATQAILEAGK
jgi:alpha-2-macroglobulin-like protein